ncbi:phosphatidate cytidylyltransferase [Sporolactobacillus sp. Y61]|uniref:Phosphatidate cytidylyltransferase n=1 Tax=Sporolactobacillus sp. Y61 TaxID=3160863 RepID=A0AAU8IC73_9BACL
MKQRVLTGVVAGALYLAFLLYGSYPFAIMAAMIAGIAFTETALMDRMKYSSGPVLIGMFFVIAIVLFPFFSDKGSFEVLFIRLLILFILVMAVMTFFSKNHFDYTQAAYLTFSALYISIPFYLLVQMRFHSLALVLFVQITIWATDSGAYFVGRSFGKHKLAPHISPNKTIEGSAGAIIVALLTAVIFQLIAPAMVFHSWFELFIAALIISVAGQMGDLVESAVKRHFNVKDSGSILPGHGGLFDRFDSLIFVLPLLYLTGII